MKRANLILIAGALIAGLAVGLGPAPAQGQRSAAPDVRWLLAEVDRLTAEVADVRRRLAEAQVGAADARREADELRSFIDDHFELGNDFQQYRSIKAIAERESRRKETEAGRARRDAAAAERRARQQAIRDQRAVERKEQDRLDRYDEAGFSSLGLDIFAGRMAYSYQTRETNPVRVKYDPLIGLYYRPGGPSQVIDFNRMTISGSILNATPEVRNVGIAITFFDEDGNQVGSEIVRINNARPDVPYPFTSTIEMALDRTFSSSSTYVLYADPMTE